MTGDASRFSFETVPQTLGSMNLHELAERFARHDLRIANGRVNDPLTTVATSQITTKYVYFVLNQRQFWYGLDYDYEYEYYEFAYQAHYYEDIFFDDGYDRYAASLLLNPQYGKNNYLTDYSYPEGCPNEDVGNGCTRLSKSDYRYREVRWVHGAFHTFVQGQLWLGPYSCRKC